MERPVSFDIAEQNGRIGEVVHSLAKWKRYALDKYDFEVGSGLYTDMNAIRRDEITDNIHSIFVDQWDWEKVIDKNQRNLDTLKKLFVMFTKYYARLKNICPFSMTISMRFCQKKFSL